MISLEVIGFLCVGYIGIIVPHLVAAKCRNGNAILASNARNAIHFAIVACGQIAILTSVYACVITQIGTGRLVIQFDMRMNGCPFSRALSNGCSI